MVMPYSLFNSIVAVCVTNICITKVYIGMQTLLWSLGKSLLYFIRFKIWKLQTHLQPNEDQCSCNVPTLSNNGKIKHRTYIIVLFMLLVQYVSLAFRVKQTLKWACVEALIRAPHPHFGALPKSVKCTLQQVAYLNLGSNPLFHN